MTAACCTELRPASQARLKFAPLLKADWRDALFIHFRVDPAILQPLVPLELDLYAGQAYVSLVAFTQARLRPCFGGTLAEWLSRPLGTHEFLNLRTYVRRGDERGIFFLAEWIPNRLAVLLGPRLYGLPYHLGQCGYVTRGHETERHVTCPAGHFDCYAGLNPGDSPRPCEAGSEAAFLLERYTAFTQRNGVLRRFRIRHDPWGQVAADVTITRCDLLPAGVPSAPCAAHYSQGVEDVQIGRPEVLSATNRTSWLKWLPLFALPLLALLARSRLPAWAFMWLLAYAIFFACRWLTYRRATIPTTRRRALGYLFAWPGMDANAFLDVRRTPPPRAPFDWFPGMAKVTAAATILWLILRRTPHLPPLLAGSLGMIGIALLLHFGAFDLLARLWQRAGVDATPIMNRPLLARSLSDFWGSRWNLGFRTLSHDLLFRPLSALLGVAGAALATFFASGLIHDLVISLPARGGYGGPTLYFTLQGLGVAIERSAIGKALGLRRGVTGRAFAAFVLLVPLPLLFPPPFMLRVIVPFLHAIHSYGEVLS